MRGFGQDLRYAVRQLHKSPGFALAVILTLALGIGVNTAVFSLVNGFLLRPLPFPQPDRLGVLLLHTEQSANSIPQNRSNLDGETWIWVRDNLSSVHAATVGGVGGVNLQTGPDDNGGVRYAVGMRVSAHYFDVIGVPMLFGREFTEEEDRPGGPPATILSYALWHSTFQGDRQIIGKTIRLKGQPSTVVGVLPAGVQTTETADLWTPLQPAASGECGGYNCEIIMRLKPDANWQQVASQLTHLRKPFFDEIENKGKGHAWFYASPMQRETGRDTRSSLLVLMLAVSFILLIACGNLAGLTLVRIARRTPEVATRLALGATHWTILRQLWAENLLLSLLGALVGLALAITVLKFLTGFLPEGFIPLGGFGIDIRVLAFTLLTSLVACLFFGALPSLQARQVDLKTAMGANSRSVAKGSSRLRQSLIAGEVALTCVLSVGAGLLIRTLVFLETQPPGFEATNVITAKASLDDARYHDSNAFHNLLEQSTLAMKQVPGVENAAVALSVPFEMGLNDQIKIMDGKLAGKLTESSLTYVTAGFFDALRIPILVGRGIAEDDTAGSEPVAVVNRNFAREILDEPTPIGRHIKLEGKSYRIVGVAGDVAKQPGLTRNTPMGIEPLFYIAATQIDQGLADVAHVWFQPSWIVRTSKPLEGVTGAMQKALAQVDPSLPFSGFYSMKDILAESLLYQRAEVLLLGVLAGLALLLSAVGIYGLVSNLVVQRTREIGIRLALGAPLRQVMAQIGKSGIIATAAGIVVGLILAMFSVRVLQSQLYGVRVYDPVTLLTVPLVLAMIAIAASTIPALRIARIDPAETLRAE